MNSRAAAPATSTQLGIPPNIEPCSHAMMSVGAAATTGMLGGGGIGPELGVSTIVVAGPPDAGPVPEGLIPGGNITPGTRFPGNGRAVTFRSVVVPSGIV